MKTTLFKPQSKTIVQFKWSALAIASLLLTGCSSLQKERLVDLDKIPNAQPRLEALSTKANRQYIVSGKTYTPFTQLQPYKQRGMASWYGKKYHGKPTASGENFDMYSMTAAHPLLPIPSYAKVTNVLNGRSVILRVNDRGPFVDDRIIDLSYVAAYKLGILNKGFENVEVESIIPTSTTPQLSDSMPPQIQSPVSVQAQNNYNIQIPVVNARNMVYSDIPSGTAGGIMKIAQNTYPQNVPQGQYYPPLNQSQSTQNQYPQNNNPVGINPISNNSNNNSYNNYPQQPPRVQPQQANPNVPVSNASGFNNQYGVNRSGTVPNQQPIYQQNSNPIPAQPMPQAPQLQQAVSVQPPLNPTQYQQPQAPQYPINYPQPIQNQMPQYQQPQQADPNPIRFQPNVRPADINQAYQPNPLGNNAQPPLNPQPQAPMYPPVQVQPLGQPNTPNNYDPNAFNQNQPQQAQQADPNATNYPEPSNQGIFIQVGAYKVADRAEQAKAKFNQAFQQYSNLGVIYYKDGWFKFQIGPFTNRQLAGQFALSLQPIYPDKPSILSR